MDDDAQLPGPPSFTVQVRPPIILVTAEGRFTLENWMNVLQGVLAAPGFEPGFHSLVDARNAHFDFRFADAQDLAARIPAYLERRGRGFRSAYVVGSEADFGISRMVQTVLDTQPISASVFRTLEEAEAWLREAPGSA